MPMSFLQIPEGKYTATIYGFIRENCHQHLDASKMYVPALKSITEIIKEGIRDHPGIEPLKKKPRTKGF
ncbi:hypothetical protein BC831DRAFT_515442 [Entophlyctis helioformis]|nr:hypothetical protein BC831DRAFT_515442 [Entophlyctis helioformis]